jgi:spore coat protein U-like protein
MINSWLRSLTPFLFPRAALIVLIACGCAHAQTCTVSLPAIAFGNVNVLAGAAVDTTATVTVTCSGGTGNAGQRACISIGAGSANDATSRQMTGPSSNTARYDLYSNSGRTTLWGSWQTGYDTTGVQLDVPKNGSATATVYARFLASQQTVAAGSYTATFTANPFIQYANKTATPCPTGGLTSSTSTSVTATVLSSCNVAATAVNFGSRGLLTTTTDAQGTLSIQCSTSLPYTVSLDGGTSGATDPTQRKMTFSGANVTYGLYRDAARSLAWGSTLGTNTTSGTGTGLTQTQTVYGRVPTQTTPMPGAYSDSVVVTVGY